MVLAVALLVGAGVAFTGIVGSWGWSCRTWSGWWLGRRTGRCWRLRRWGALVDADLLARTAVANAELPLGMLTSLVGGPFFFWLPRRTRRRQGGWA